MLNFLKKLVAKVLIPAACLLSVVPILDLGFLQNSRANDDVVAHGTEARRGDNAGTTTETESEEGDEIVQVIETSAGEMRIYKSGRVFIFRE